MKGSHFWLRSLTFPVLILLWEVFARLGFFNVSLFPSPLAVAKIFWEDLITGMLPYDTA